MQSRSNLSLGNFESLADKSAKFTSLDIELVCREVRNAILLEEISSSLTTADIITYINNLQEGGLEDVLKVLLCVAKNYRSP